MVRWTTFALDRIFCYKSKKLVCNYEIGKKGAKIGVMLAISVPSQPSKSSDVIIIQNLTYQNSSMKFVDQFVIPYSTKLWQGKTLANRLFQSFW